MIDIVILLPQVTVHRHRFWFRDNESVCYYIEPDTAHDIAYHAQMLPFAIMEYMRYVGLGAIRVTRRVTASVELPLKTLAHGQQTTPVSPSWIVQTAPLLLEAYYVYQATPEESFTLVVDDAGQIVRTEPDRKSIPPQKE